MTASSLIALCSLVNAIALRVNAGGEPPANTAEGATGDPTPPPDLDESGESDTGWLTPAGLLQQDDCGDDERGYYGVCIVHTRAEAVTAWTDAVRDAAPVVVSDDIRVMVAEVLRRAGATLHTLSAAEDRDSALAYAAPILAREVQRLQAESSNLSDQISATRAELVRAQAERDELQRALWAERGDKRGAPSEGWAFVGGVWKKGDFSVWSDANGWDVLWFNDGAADEIGTYETARAAMIAADKAMEAL